MKNSFTELLNQHFVEAKNKYTGLTLTLKDETVTITGPLRFAASYDGVSITDTYDIEIILPDDYPKTPPSARETRGKIPGDFHKLHNGKLCLASPLETRKQFIRQADILGYIENLLVPYLYCYSHKLKYNFLPYGDLSHGESGLFEACREILNSYKTKFKVSSDIEVMKLLKILAEDNYKGHLKCPCGSTNILRKCHGKVLLELIKQQNKNFFLEEYFWLLTYLFPQPKDIPKELISKRLSVELKKL